MSLMSFIQASAHSLPMLADGSVQMIATSPPYYGLRKYEGAQDVDWPAVDYAPMPGLRMEWVYDESAGEWVQDSVPTAGEFMLHVPAMRSPLGNEPTLEAYIAHLILCLREWRRVLRDDGVCFVNLGDSFAGSATGGFRPGSGRADGIVDGRNQRNRNGNGCPAGIKPKDLMMVPARFALAAQADGWFLRSDIIGRKVAPMPESVTDRPTRSHEHIFMLTKRASYFCDMDAVREEPTREWWKEVRGPKYMTPTDGRNDGGKPEGTGNPAGRNLRDVLRFNGDFAEYFKSLAPDDLAIVAEEMAIAIMRGVPLDVIEWRPQGFSAAHFATWPEAIPDMLIRMGTSERGACPHCGAPWVRVVEREADNSGYTNGPGGSKRYQNVTNGGKGSSTLSDVARYVSTTIAWQPSCTCLPAFSEFGVPVGGDDIEAQRLAPTPVPCVVLDPFSGSGTTVKAAAKLGRQGIGVDISAEYLDGITAARMGNGFQMEMI